MSLCLPIVFLSRVAAEWRGMRGAFIVVSGVVTPERATDAPGDGCLLPRCTPDRRDDEPAFFSAPQTVRYKNRDWRRRMNATVSRFVAQDRWRRISPREAGNFMKIRLFTVERVGILEISLP